MVGILAAPYVFAETNVDYETTLFTDPDGDYTIEFPSDGWSIHPYSGTYPEAMIKDSDGKTVIIISRFGGMETRGDMTDQEIFTSNYLHYVQLCSKNSAYGTQWEYGFSYYSCYNLEKVDKKIDYTNQGKKLWILDLTFTTYEKHHLIDAETIDEGTSWNFSARTTVKDSKQAWKFDTENLQKIREIIKSFTILKPDTTPELESEQVETPQTKIQKVPDWVRNIFIWYGEEQISEDELLNAIKFLVNQGIINLDS